MSVFMNCIFRSWHWKC